MIGRSFKYKLLESDKARKVVAIESGLVKFDDGGVIEETMLNELFEEVPTAAVDTPMVNENQTTIQQNTQPAPDPNNFFDSSNLASRIINDAKSIDTTGLADLSSTPGAREVEKPVEQMIDTPTDQANQAIKKVEATRNDFTAEDHKFAGTQPENTPQQPTATQTNVPPAKPTNSFLHQLKKNHKVKLHLEIDEQIPKPDFIRMMDENFNNGVLDQLVTEMVDKYLRNPMILERAIKAQLEEIVYGKKKTPTKPKRRTTTKRTTTATKKPVEKKIDTKNESKDTADIPAETAEDK